MWIETQKVTLLITTAWYDPFYGENTCPRNYCIHTEVSSLDIDMQVFAKQFYPQCIAHYEQWINNDGVNAELELVLLGHVTVHKDYEYYVLHQK